MKATNLGLRLLALGAGLAISAAAAAQAFPNKPLKLIIGYGPGGVTDVINRVVADEMGKRLGQPVTVENRPGANALLAAQAVKNAAPDGYTLYGGSATTFAPVYMKENMIASKELAPVATSGLGDWFMYVPTSLGINNLKELAAWAKANPGKMRFAAPSPSNTMLFARVAKDMGFTYEAIPYKTTDQTIQALIAGDAQVTFNAASGFDAMLQAGKLKAISTLAPGRVAIRPDVPSATEQGVPLVVRFNQGIWTTLGTPRDVILKLNAAVNEGIKAPAAAEKIRNAALAIQPMTPEEVAKAYDQELQFYTEAAKLINYQPQ
jgi:tripartite-type tricarboxylate transporter receptor subunit TctC